ncbi:PIN domain-containing protein [Candidatus Saccharibacteria bacterium]|nr:PIN domain-containing protein [Candidatus Saccharibacteria bacterium]
METSSLDTNLVVHYLLGDVLGQREAVAMLLRRPGATYYFTNMALSETFYVFEKYYKFPREEVVNFLSFFLTRYDGIIIYDRELTKLAFPSYLAHPKLSWTDCALAAEAEIHHHEPLFTFDKKLASRLPQAKLVG